MVAVLSTGSRWWAGKEEREQLGAIPIIQARADDSLDQSGYSEKAIPYKAEKKQNRKNKAAFVGV